jgi:hypothetical protein
LELPHDSRPCTIGDVSHVTRAGTVIGIHPSQNLVSSAVSEGLTGSNCSPVQINCSGVVHKIEKRDAGDFLVAATFDDLSIATENETSASATPAASITTD